MPEPPAPVAPVPPVPLTLDRAAAQALARSLDALALALAGVVRGEGARAHGATADWRGYTRAWFDERHRAAVEELARAARSVAAAADEVRREELVAVARQRARSEEAAAHAHRAAVVELERLAALAPR